MNRKTVPAVLTALAVLFFSVAIANTPAAPSTDRVSLTATAQSTLVGDSAQFSAADEEGRYVFLIEFDEPGLLDLHRQTRAPGTRFDASAVDMQSESQMMSSRHQSRLSSMSSTLRRDVVASHFFQVTHSGMAVRLTEAEARRVSADPAIRSIQRERLYSLDTFAGPEFIGAGEVWDGTATPNGIPVRGLGMIAGVLDSGILPNHPSFLNDPNCGHGDNGIPNKLLSFVDCSAATGPGGRCNGSNPVDTNGHGTHVAGTMAGNALLRDSGPTPRPNPPVGFGISGVAQCASIRNYKVCPGASCPGADIQAGMNTLLLDGDVDAMNFSISGGTNPWLDNDRRKLDLVDAGVFVNASAGNTGPSVPNPIGTVNHRGPWVVAVAASTRPGSAPEGTVSITGPGTPPTNLTNIAVAPGSASPPSVGVINGPIRFDPNQPAGADGCVGFPADFFDGAIALVERGTCAFVDKINNAAAAGAIMVIIRNNQAGALSMGTGGQVNVPAYSIPAQATGVALRDFIAANPGATLRFTPSDLPLGDVLANFSLRGPTPGALANLQKPDITAPGVGIYAAHVAAGGYTNLSGTSMSGPHLSGAALLVRQMQPDWAPTEVASALRMTARKQGFKENGTTPWDWDDVGSGRVDLTRAGFAGMVMNETTANFLAANPATGGDVRTLNLPAIRNVSCNDTCTFTRTVRNTRTEPTSWTVSSEMRSGNFDIQVSPSSFSFNGGLNETQTITVTVSPIGTNSLSFGTIDFESTSDTPNLHWTLALAGTGTGGPQPEGVTGLNFEGTVAGITGDPEGVWASDLRMNVTSPAGATFAVGGFGAGSAPVPWDFDGAGSATDGTYSSAHPGVFGAGTEQEGNWTFEFIHTYPPGATMTWDPVTIELTGPGRDVVLETISIPAFVLGGGQSTSFTIPVGDVPATPEIAVEPAVLEVELPAGGLVTRELSIANVGEGLLEYNVGFLVEGALRPLSDTIINQATNGTQGIVSTLFEGFAGGATGGYSSENFAITGNTTLSTITTRGFMGAPAAGQPPVPATTINNISWFIFPDDNGVPSGNPETAPGSAVWSFTAPRVSTGVNLGIDGSNVNITLDLAAAGQNVVLPPGNYWLVMYTSQAGGVTNGRWNWFQGAPADSVIPKIITPGGAFGGAFPNWADLTGVNPVFTGLSLAITGDVASGPVCQGDGPTWLSLSATSGSVLGGDEDVIDVTFDTTGLAVGSFSAELCIESNDPANPLVVVPVNLEVAGESALLQVAHLAPFDSDLATTEVDILLNGEIALAGVPYGASTGPIPLPAGTYDIAIRLAGTSTEVLSVSDVVLEEGVKYTAIANGNIDLQPLGLALLVDNLDPPAAGNFKLRLGHLAPFASGSAAAEVRLSNGDLIQAVDFGDITGFTELPAGTYDLQITGPGGSPVLIDPIPLTFDAGDIISAFAVGDGVNQPLGIYALPPTAPGFFVPLVGQSAEIEVTPDNFGFTLEAGESTSDTLTIANLGNGLLNWSIDTAEGPAYGTVFGDRAPVNLPQGFDRASGRQVEAGAAFDAVILPAQQPAAITDDFSEGFDDITLLPGLGWALINNSAPLGGTGWFQGNPAVFPAHEGATNSYIGANFNNTSGATGTISNWLLTPEIAIQNGTRVTFWSRVPTGGNAFPDRLEVRLSTAGGSTDVGATATSVGDFDTRLLVINENLDGNYPEVWTQYEIELSGIAAPTTGRVAFRYFVTDAGPQGDNSSYIGIDTVSVTQPEGEPPLPTACDAPSEISWLSVSPGMGMTNPGASSSVTVNVDSAGLAPDTYSALLCVFSNDPDAPITEVPVSLTVEPSQNPAQIAVAPTSLEGVVDEGDSLVLDLTISNLGGLDLNWAITEDGNAGQVLRAQLGGTVPEWVQAGAVTGLASRSGAMVGQTAGPFVITNEGITLTHSASNAVTAGNTVACSPDGGVSTSENFFYRTFTLSDFEITSAFAVEEVTFGIENLSSAQPITVNLYTLDGAFTMANLTLIGSATQTLADQALSLVTIPVTGEVPAGGTLVVEIAPPDLSGQAAFFPGSNGAGETAPSFIRSSACGLAEPTPFAGINFPQVQLVMSVTGTTAATGPSCELPDWISVNPASGTVGGASSQTVSVTLDSAGLPAGNFDANLCISSNDATNGLVTVPVSLTVESTVIPPSITVDPTSISSGLLVGETATETLDIGNVGGSDLDWSVFTARSVVNNAVTGAIVGRGDSNPAFISDFLSAGGAGLPFSSGAVITDAIDCNNAEGLIILDDNTIENGYSGNPAAGVTNVRFVQRYQPAEPGLLGSVCVHFVSLGPTSLNFELVVYDADGPDGQPGTRIGALAATATGLTTGLPPGGVPNNWVTVDMSSLGIVVESGSVYIGVAYAPSTPNVFIASDQSPGTAPATGFWWNNNANAWATITSGWPDYRAIMVRPQFLDTAVSCDNPDDVSWLSVDPASGTTAAGATSSITVNLDATGLGAGVFEAALCVQSNDPVNPVVVVPVSLEVTDPQGSFLEGTVSSLGYCGENPFAAAGATILVEGVDNDFTLTADENGFFSLALSALEAPLTITASAPDHISETVEGVGLTVGETTVVDFDLVLEAACATVAPDAFEIIAIEGSIVEDILNIGNVNGAAELEWSIELEPQMIQNSDLERFGLTTAVIRDFTPELNEVLNVPNFTAISAPNGGQPVEFSLPAGVASSGQVVGFTFEGTVTGITGNASWASDLRMIITSPSGASFNVGGFSQVINPWEFDGSASTADGTYVSVHVGAEVFGEEGTGDVGDWTLVFTNDWDSTAAADMAWSDVTVTLHKSGPVACAQPDDVPWILVDPTDGTIAAGEDQDVSVLFDSTGVPPGQYGAFICVTTSDAENPLVPVPVLFDIRTDSLFQDRFEEEGRAAKQALEQ